MIVLILSVLIVLPLNAGLVGAIEPEQETSGSGENYTWNQRSPVNAPSQRTAPLMAYDQKEGRTLLFGGFVGGDQIRLNDTWIWDGENWSAVNPQHKPAPRSGGGMAYDQATQRIVMFGGDGVGISLGDTWLWNWEKMDWEQQDPFISPPPRGIPFMSYDYKNSNVVLFGGGTSNEEEWHTLNDTWVWDGANHTWVKKNPAHSPSARAFGQMSYDPINQNVVLFGGNGNGQFLSDTWTWDGTDWTQHATANTPPARLGYGLSYDGAHIILFGGDGAGNVQLSDTWFWDGSNWTQQNIVTNNRGHIGMVYDERKDQVVSFGGYGGSSGSPIINETWTLQSSPIVTTGSVESLGSTYAELNGELVMTGKKPVLEQGIEIKNLTNNETVKYLSQNSGIGAFTVKASNLMSNTSYTYRAYATDFYGVTYASNEGSFNTLEHPPIYLDSTNYSLRVGGTHQTVVEALNEEDNSRYVVTEDLTFSSADSEIASVDENGLVTAHSEGETVITVLYKTIPVQITVKVSYVAPVLVNIASESNKYTLEKGKTQQTVIKAVYDDGTYLPLTDDLVFTSLDENIATVDSNGLITAKTAGTVQIKVSYSDITIVIDVTVKDNSNSGGGSGESPGGSSGGNGSGGGSDSNSGGNDTTPTSSSGTPKPTNPSDNLKDPVSGEPIGTVVKQEKDGKKETTIKLDVDKAKDTLNKSNRKSLDIDSNEDVDQTVTEIPGPLAKWLDEKEGSVELKTKLGRYVLPVKQLGVSQLTTGNNEEQSLKELQYKVTMSKASDSVMQNVKSIATKDGYSVIGSAVNFGVSSSMNGVEKKVPNFDQYAVRLIALPEGYDPNKITTGIIYDQSQKSFMHVPTQVVKLDGQYFAKINSLVSEGTFALIWNEETFADTANHWGKDIIDEMASRLVVEGVTEKTFDPNREITRAEFAAIAVRAFGLQDETAKGQGFEDVASDSWYSEYVNTASAYGLLKGYNDGSFKPTQHISRQEATAILARAIKLAKIDASVTDINTLSAYKDANEVSEWAQINVSYLVEKGIMAGDTTGKLHVRNAVTRAETAALMQRILKFAELI